MAVTTTTTTAAPSVATGLSPQQQLEVLREKMPWLLALISQSKGVDFLDLLAARHSQHQWSPVVYQDLFQFLQNPANMQKIALLLKADKSEAEKAEVETFLSDLKTKPARFTFDEKAIAQILRDFGSKLARDGINLQELPQSTLASALKVYGVSLAVSPLNLISPHRAFIESIHVNLGKESQIMKEKLEKASQEIVEAWQQQIVSSQLFDQKDMVSPASSPFKISRHTQPMCVTSQMLIDLQRGLFYRNSVSVRDTTNTIKVLFQKKEAPLPFFSQQMQESQRKNDCQEYIDSLPRITEALPCGNPMLHMGISTLLFTQTLFNQLIAPLVPHFADEGMRIDTKNRDVSFLFSPIPNEDNKISVEMIVSVPMENPGLVIKAYFSFTLVANSRSTCILSEGKCSQILVQGGGYIIPVATYFNRAIHKNKIF